MISLAFELIGFADALGKAVRIVENKIQVVIEVDRQRRVVGA